MRKFLLFIVLSVAGFISAAAETITFTYYYIYEGVIVLSETFEREVGETFPDSELLPDFINYVLPDGSVESTTGNFYIMCELADNFPFHVTYSYANAHWYFLQMGGKYMVYDKSTKSISLVDELPLTDFAAIQSAAWSFTGNPFEGFKIINKAVGDKDYPVMPAVSGDKAGSLWDVKRCPFDSGSFFLTEQGTEDYLSMDNLKTLKVSDAEEYVIYDLKSACYAPTSITPEDGSTVAKLDSIRLHYKTWPGMIDAEEPIFVYNSEGVHVSEAKIDYDDNDDYSLWIFFGNGSYEDFDFVSITKPGTYTLTVPTATIWEGEHFNMWASDYGVSQGAIFNNHFSLTYTVDPAAGIHTVLADTQPHRNYSKYRPYDLNPRIRIENGRKYLHN